MEPEPEEASAFDFLASMAVAFQGLPLTYLAIVVELRKAIASIIDLPGLQTVLVRSISRLRDLPYLA